MSDIARIAYPIMANVLVQRTNPSWTGRNLSERARTPATARKEAYAAPPFTIVKMVDADGAVLKYSPLDLMEL